MFALPAASLYSMRMSSSEKRRKRRCSLYTCLDCSHNAEHPCRVKLTRPRFSPLHMRTSNLQYKRRHRLHFIFMF